MYRQVTQSSAPNNDYTEREFTSLDLTSDGGTSFWLAYRSDPSVGDGGKPPIVGQDGVYVQLVGDGDKIFTYPSADVNDPEWNILFIANSEIWDDGSGADPNAIDNIRIGGTSTSSALTSYNFYIDALTNCGPICPSDYGDGVFAPPFTYLTSDLNQDCAVNEDDLWIIVDAWLWEDILGVKPSDSNLIVEYLFATALEDTSGNGNTGVGVNEPNVHDGLVTLDGNDWVTVPISDINLFKGDKAWSVAMDYDMPGELGILFSSADVCGWGAQHIVTEAYFGEEVSVSLQIVEGGDSWGPTPLNEQTNHSIVVTYDPEEEAAMVYMDGYAGEYPTEGAPPDPCGVQTQVIGWTVVNPDNLPDPWFMERFVGDIDNFRIYDYALDTEGIIGLLPSGEFRVDDLEPNPNIKSDGAFPANIIDFLDQATFAPQWYQEKIFE
jgi:hypothetical protein